MITRALLLALALLFAASHARAQPTFTGAGGTGVNHFGSPVSVNFTSANNNLVYAWVVANGGAAPALSGCATTWLPRAAVVLGGFNVYSFYAFTPVGLAACSVTASSAGSGSVALLYGAYAPVNAIVFDTSFPAVLSNSGASGAQSVAGVGNTQSHSSFLTMNVAIGTTFFCAPTAYSGGGSVQPINTQNSISSFGASANYIQETTPTTGTISTPASGLGCGPAWVMVVDALTADAPISDHSRLIGKQ